MGAFFIVRHKIPEDRRVVADRLSKAFIRQGFGQAKMFAAPGCEIYLYTKLKVSQYQLFYRDSNNFACFTGTPFYRGETGAAAAKLLFEHFSIDTPEWNEIFGHYCAILCRDGDIRLFIDRMGIYKVYKDSNNLVISTSFLAVAEAIDAPSINSQSVYEYVFQGATYGEHTVFNEVQITDCEGAYHIGPNLDYKPWNDAFIPNVNPASFEEHLARNLENLRRVYNTITTHYGDNIDTALSGGYDSRLTLALLQEQGIQPKIHVYGRDGDHDVRVARTIADGEGFTLSHIDKNQFPLVDIEAYPTVVERNFQAFDGFPSDGIFDNGVDLHSRLERCAGEELMLNGGGGEIFRNFFYLFNRQFSIKQFLWSFYNRYDPRTCTGYFSENVYLSTLGKKIMAVLGHGHSTLSRAQIEYLYPSFRCRFWMGKNNSINNKLGWALTPFIDYTIVKDAVSIPLAYKNSGRFEAAMIRAVSPALARHPSVYGHDFASDPPLSRIIKDLTTLIRPAFLRRYTYRIQFRRPRMRSRYVSDDYIGAVLDRAYPYLSAYFQITHLNDPDAFRRVCTLEYLFERYQPIQGAPLRSG